MQKVQAYPPFDLSQDFTVVTEGLTYLQHRTKIFVKLGIKVIGHHNYNNVPVILTNTSNQTATIGKVAKISECSNDFIEE